MSKSRILFIAQAAGGVSNYLSMLLSHIDNSKYEKILICSKDYERSDFSNIVDHFEYIEMTRDINIFKDIKSIFELRKKIKEYQPNIVYLHSSKAGALGRIATIGLKNKIIYNPHGWAFNMKASSLKTILYKYVEKILAYRTNKIIAISDYENISAIEKKITKKDKLILIENGIDIDKINLYSVDDKLINKSVLNIPEDSYIVGMIGRISMQKAPDIFVKAAKIIKERIPKAFFIIVGDGENREEIEELIKEYDLSHCFLITGWVKNPISYLRLFDQALLLSRWEGFGLALAEYMVCGKAIIATNTNAIPFLIENNVNGILVDVDNYVKAADATLYLFNNKIIRDEFISYNIALANKRFNIDRVVKQHTILFDTLTNL